MEINRPSVTQGNNNVNPSSAGGQRSPRTSGNIKNQFYAVHGRGMNLNGAEGQTTGHKGILTKIFKNQNARANGNYQQQNY